MNRLKLLTTIIKNDLTNLLLNGNFGVEKEGLRATLPADLAPTMHPEALGDREINPHIRTDYGEAQPEIITPPLSPYINAHNWLQMLSKVLLSCLPEEEYMWPFSVPCNLPDEELINISKTTNPELAAYRLYTAAKYGKKRQLVNGIHINYSFHNDFLDRLFVMQHEFETVEEMRDNLYLKLASNFLRYQWLLIYLLGATPVAEADFFDAPFFKNKKLPAEPMRSLRKSIYGFTNDPKVVVRYDTITNYAYDLQNAVAEGLLQKEREYYGDVRLRGIVKDTSSLLENGIQYIEFRSFDNDPYHVSGISLDTLQFIHLFFVTMLLLPEKATAEDTEFGNELTKRIANEHPLAKTQCYAEGQWLCEQMLTVAEQLDLEQDYLDLVEAAKDQLEHPERTISGRIHTDLKKGFSFLELGERLGIKHKEELLSHDGLAGFEHLDPEQVQHLFSIIQLGLDVPLEYIQAEHLEI